MQSLCLMIARVSLAGWVGAAALFVVTSIREQVSPAFDSTIRSTLATIRFPAYYAFGFTMVAIAILCVLIARNHDALTKLRTRIALGMLLAALVLMIADYFWIYQPLVEMITPLDKPPNPDFPAYHTASKHINELDLTLCFVAAVCICWPARNQSVRTPGDLG